MRSLLILATLFAALLFTGCESEGERLCFSQDDESCTEYNYCPDYYDPVCGTNGVTYSNDCEAENAGVGYSYGACWYECESYEQPVCGYNGITYRNPCEAERDNMGYSYGACKMECFSNEPVCGVDGVTYENLCTAESSGIYSYSYGPCETECPPVECALYCPFGYKTDNSGCATCECVEVTCDCPADVDPVCGTDGKTYSNSCEAECSNIAIDYAGSCESTITGCVQHDECAPKEQCVVAIESCQCDASGCYCPEGGHCIELKEGCYKDRDCDGNQACVLPESCSCDDTGCYCTEAGRCIPRAPEVCILDEQCPAGFSCTYVDDCYLNEDGVVDCNGFGYCTPLDQTTTEGGSR